MKQRKRIYYIQEKKAIIWNHIMLLGLYLKAKQYLLLPPLPCCTQVNGKQSARKKTPPAHTECKNNFNSMKSDSRMMLQLTFNILLIGCVIKPSAQGSDEENYIYISHSNLLT